MPTNTRESGLETLIVDWLVQHNGFEQGVSADYNREYAFDEARLFRFLQVTQPEQMEMLGVDTSDLKRTQFLNRLTGEIAKRGVIDVLRSWVK
jgi:type I restriction enzyme R subunit